MVADSAYDWELLVDRDRRVLYSSPSCKRITGHDADEFLRDPQLLAEIVHPQDRERYLRHCDRAERGATETHLEFRIVRADGPSLWIGHACHPVLDANGALIASRITNRDITEGKRAELEARASSLYARTLIEASLDPLVTISPDGEIMDVNKATEEATGLAREALVGTDFADYFTDASAARAGYRLVLERGLVRDYPLTLRHALGRTIDVLYNATVYRNEAGELEGVFAAARDITDRRRAGAAQARLAAIVESSGDAIIGKTLDGTITSWNRAAERVYGYSADEVIGKQISMLAPPERLGEITSLLEGARQSHGVQGYETVRRRKDGTDVEVSLTLSPIVDSDGELIGVSTIARDITDCKRAEEALRASEARLNEAQRIAHIGNWQLDLERNALSWSEEIYRIFELEPRTFGASYEAFLNAIHPDDREEVNRAYTDSLASRAPYDVAHRLLMADGRVKWVHERCETVFDAGGRPLRSMGTVQDITARKLAEDALQQLNRELEQRVATRTAELEAAMKELEGFSYSVSHDLRTPLRAIDGFSRIVLRDYADRLDDEGKRLLNVVRDSTIRMGRLIDDILAFSRAGRLELRAVDVDLEALVRDVWLDLAPSRTGRVVELAIGSLPKVRGDPAMLRQVFANVLGNAIKFTSRKAVAHVEVSATRCGDECALTVKDDGVGFDQQYGHKLFGVFQRLHGVSEFEGTGIGLAIVKRVVSRHGGTVRAEGEVDAGATIHLTLPLARTAP